MRDIGMQLPSLPIKELYRSRVLEYFEGCLLVEYRTASGDIYLFLWVDSNQEYNRWIVFRIGERDLARYLQRNVSLRELLFDCRDGFVYVIDTDGEGDRRRISLSSLDDLPPDYIPGEESMFDPELMPRNSRQSHGILINGSWSLRDLADFPRVYRNTYNMLYRFAEGDGEPGEDDEDYEAFAQRTSDEGSDEGDDAEDMSLELINNDLYPPPQEMQFDIHGGHGFATNNLYASLEKHVPEAQKPQLLALAYSSPGVISMSLNIGVSGMVREAVARLTKHNGELSYLDDLIYKAVHKDERMTSMDLEENLRRFANLLGNLNYDNLKVATRQIEFLADLLRAHLRMLRRLAKYLDLGKVQSL